MEVVAFARAVASVATLAAGVGEPSSDETEVPTVVFAAQPGAGSRQTDVEALTRSFIAPHADVLEVRLPTLPAGLASRARWASSLARDEGALGVFWIDLDDPQHAVLLRVTAAGERVLARTIPRDAKNPAATGDAIGIIAGSISSALVAGAVVGMVEVDAALQACGAGGRRRSPRL